MAASSRSSYRRRRAAPPGRSRRKSMKRASRGNCRHAYPRRSAPTSSAWRKTSIASTRAGWATCWVENSLLPHQHERIGGCGKPLPGRGIALGKAPAAAAAGEQQPVAIEPPSRKPDVGDRRVTTGLDRDLVVFASGRGTRQREAAKRLLEFLEQGPFAEHLLRADRGLLDGVLGAHEEEPLPFALGLVHVRLDFHEIENDEALGIQQPHLIVRPHGPDPDILERREGGAAGFIELELEATGGRVELEGGRAGLVARGVGNLPGADHLLGGVARRRCLRAGAGGGERKRDHSETSASRHGGNPNTNSGWAHAITPDAPRHASPARTRTALRHAHMQNLRALMTVSSSAAMGFPRPGSAAACPLPRPRDCRPPAGPSCRGSRPTPSRDGETARRGPWRWAPCDPGARAKRRRAPPTKWFSVAAP